MGERRSWGRRNVEGDIVHLFTDTHDDCVGDSTPRRLPTLPNIRSNSLRDGTTALFKLERSAAPRNMSESLSLMFRSLLRLLHEFSDTFGPVKSSPTSTDVQNERRTYNSSSSLKRTSQDRQVTTCHQGTYLELDSIFTDSLTCCKDCLEPEGASCFPPDAAA